MLEELINNAQVWKASEQGLYKPPTKDSGIKSLNEILPGNGWPMGAVTEVLYHAHGIGELRLLAPLLSQLSHEAKWILWITPPFTPYPVALKNYSIDYSKILLVKGLQPNKALWAIEQALHSNQCSAVLAWPQQINSKQIRRLQMLCSQTENLCFIFRPPSARDEHSSAHLRLQLHPCPLASNKVSVDIFKRKGSWPVNKIIDLDIPDIRENILAPNKTEHQG